MATWTIWILASAFFLALYDLAKKASVRSNAVLPVLLCSTSFGCAAFVSTVALRGDLAAMLSPGGRVLVLAALKSLIVSVSWIFTFKGLRTLPISIATPIRASAPALVFVVAFFLYGEMPGIIQAIGMLLVFSAILSSHGRGSTRALTSSATGPSGVPLQERSSRRFRPCLTSMSSRSPVRRSRRRNSGSRFFSLSAMDFFSFRDESWGFRTITSNGDGRFRLWGSC